ncbi:MAG: L,D-transpeptidase family protein [Geobacteraceae bacterium]|nr:L,D-transpeptidase family protein [Geobacteraceae bacterium]
MVIRIHAVVLLVCLLLFCSGPVEAAEEFFAGNNEVIGTMKSYVIKESDSLIELARKYDLGYNEIADANVKMDPFIPDLGATVRVPTFWVLPNHPREREIIINLSELRLYYYPYQDAKFVFTFPIGIGDEGSETPLGTFTIIEKRVNPVWYVPKSIQEERPGFPAQVAPGPDNPLGTHALRLSIGSVLIHGTNKPWGTGRRVSHGCIRLYPEDIPELYQLVPKGTRVVILRQPVKLGLKNGRIYLEVHRGEDVDYYQEAMKLIMVRNLLSRVDKVKLSRVLRQKTGIPEEISR